MTYNFTDKVVLITGAASGIGAATAQSFAASGAVLALTDINEKGVESEASRLREQGAQVFTMLCDVGDAEQMETFVNTAVSELGGLGVAVDNAGVGGFPSLLADYDIETFDQVMRVNARSVFLCMKYQIPHMLEKGGVIANVASIAGCQRSPK